MLLIICFKPFGFQEFLTAVQKAKKLYELEKNVHANESEKGFLFLKSEYKIRKIEFDDILYIEGLKDYNKVFLESSDVPVLSISTVKSIEHKLPANRFMRVHRSFIVNLDKVNTIERSWIIMGGENIPVSDQYKAKFQEFIKKNFL